MRLSMRAWLFAALVCAFGCGAPSIGDDLTLTVDATTSALRIDTKCGSSCGGDTVVTATISYDNPNMTRPQSDAVEFWQYKVAYSLGGVQDVPFFAGDIRKNDIKLEPGGSASLTLQLAGSAQRDAVRKAAGKASGTATLELAGYDFDNRQIFVDAEFNVRFADFAAADDDKPDAGAANAP